MSQVVVNHGGSFMDLQIPFEIFSGDLAERTKKRIELYRRLRLIAGVRDVRLFDENTLYLFFEPKQASLAKYRDIPQRMAKIIEEISGNSVNIRPFIVRPYHSADANYALITFTTPFQMVPYTIWGSERIQKELALKAAIEAVEGIVGVSLPYGPNDVNVGDYTIYGPTNRIDIKLQRGLTEARRYSEIPYEITRLISEYSGINVAYQ